MSSLEKLQKSVEEREIMAKLSQGVPSMEDVNKSLDGLDKAKVAFLRDTGESDEIHNKEVAEWMTRQSVKIKSNLDDAISKVKKGQYRAAEFKANMTKTAVIGIIDYLKRND